MEKSYEDLLEENRRLTEEVERLKDEYDKLGEMYDDLSLSYEDALMMYDKARESIRMESELEVASRIQDSMIPKEFPQLPGIDMYAVMTPAREVGGDLYGYLLKDNKLYFCIGDVSGKGVPASLFMAQATRLFCVLATQGMMPAEICARMNDALADGNKTHMFVTFFLGLVDLQTGHLDFCNAGHNFPIVQNSSNQFDFMKMKTNITIGLFPGFKYVGEEIDSIKGKSIFVYTDGLNEAENLKLEQFGEDHILEVLGNADDKSAHQMIDTLTAAVEEHRHGAEPNDDLTMMYLKID